MTTSKWADEKARAIAAFAEADKARRASIDKLTPGDQLWADRGTMPWVVERVTDAGVLCASKASRRWFTALEVGEMYRRLEDTPMSRWFDRGERSASWPRNKGRKYKGSSAAPVEEASKSARFTPLERVSADLLDQEVLFRQLVGGSILVDSAGHEYRVVTRHDTGARYVRVMFKGDEKCIQFFELANMHLKSAK